MNRKEPSRGVLWVLPLGTSIGFLALVALILAPACAMEDGLGGSGPLAPHLDALVSAKRVEAAPFFPMRTDEEASDPRVHRLELTGAPHSLERVVVLPRDGTARLIASKIRADNRSAPRWSRFGKRRRFFLRFEDDGATVEFEFSTGAGCFTVHTAGAKRHCFYATDDLIEELILLLGL